jgi:hypothetical protein
MTHTPPVTGQTSDGYHTFDELYVHRALLLMALMREHPELSWFAPCHHDGSAIPGFFIAGMNLSTGQITYHIEDRWLPLVRSLTLNERVRAPEWDGHTAEDVVNRLMGWLAGHLPRVTLFDAPDSWPFGGLG